MGGGGGLVGGGTGGAGVRGGVITLIITDPPDRLYCSEQLGAARSCSELVVSHSRFPPYL